MTQFPYTLKFTPNNLENIDGHLNNPSVKLDDPLSCADMLKELKFINNFSILTLNIRSINRNLDRFLVFVSSFANPIDILVLTECWTNVNKPPPYVNNYKVYYTETYLNQNDGVVVYVRDGIKTTVTEPKVQDGNCLLVQVENTIAIICTYRPPCFHNPTNYLDSLDNLLQSIKSANVILTGDINLDILPGRITSQTAKYLMLMAYYGMVTGINEPTTSTTCLDHFMVRITKRWQTFIFNEITDHSPILLVIDNVKIVQSLEAMSNVKIKLDHPAIRESIAALNWDDYLTLVDTDKAADNLVDKIQTVIKANTKTVTYPCRMKPLKPWITPGVIKSIRNRNKMNKKLKRNPDDINLKNKYINHSKICTHIIKTLKKEYYESQFSKYVGNNKKLWQLIKEVGNLNVSKEPATSLLKIKANSTESLDEVNTYFTNVGKNLANNTLTELNTTEQALTSKASKASGPKCSFSLFLVDPMEVMHTIKSLKPHSAPGWDDISMKVLRDNCHILANPIAYLCNLSFTSGAFPTTFKSAIVTPVYKAGDRTQPTNYRPISLLASLSKVLERLVNKRLMAYLETNGLISENQYGFRSAKSTEDATLHLTNSIVKYLESGAKCLGVFLDLQKAFDTVSIPILLTRMENVGIRGTPLLWFRDYLNGRQQRVRISGEMSNGAPCTYGVPQGSTLGPTLFLLYINDLCNKKVKGADLLMFADDTVLLFHDHSWADVYVLSENGLRDVTSWLEESLLTLNTAKTKYLCFSKTNASKPTDDLKLKIHTYPCNRLPVVPATCNCSVLLRTDNIKYLGIIMDDTLSWNLQIQAVSNRCRKLIYVFKSLRDVVDKNSIMRVYKALAECLQTYCICTWGGAAKTLLIEAERAQRALLKVIDRLPFRYPTTDLYSTNNILSIRKLYILQIIRRYHRKTVPTLPSNTKRLNTVPMPYYFSSFARRQYEYNAPRLYNKINPKMNIKRLNNHELKNITLGWLSDLDYSLTENLFVIES